MRWIITRDYLAEQGDFESRVGVGQASDCTFVRRTVEDFDAEAGRVWQFRLYDDDGELYYEGLSRDIEQHAARAFAPLDWASGDGCIELRYRSAGEDAGPWQVL